MTNVLTINESQKHFPLKTHRTPPNRHSGKRLLHKCLFYPNFARKHKQNEYENNKQIIKKSLSESNGNCPNGTEQTD